MHIKREQHELEIGERLPRPDQVQAEALHSDVPDTDLVLQVLDEIAAVVPDACSRVPGADEVVVRVAHVDPAVLDPLLCDLA